MATLSRTVTLSMAQEAALVQAAAQQQVTVSAIIRASIDKALQLQKASA